jgi:hypothetical protein
MSTDDPGWWRDYRNRVERAARNAEDCAGGEKLSEVDI